MNISRCLMILAILIIVTGTAVGQVAGGQSGAKSVTAMEDRLVTMDLQNVLVFDALKELFKDSPNSWESNVSTLSRPRISLKIKNMPFSRAVECLARAAGLTWSVEKSSTGTKYHFSGLGQSSSVGGGHGNEAIDKGQRSTLNIIPDTSGNTFDITLDNAGLMEVLKQLFEVAKADYIINQGMYQQPISLYSAQNTSISARLRHANLDSVLDLIVKSSGMNIEKVGSTYLIGSPAQTCAPRF